MMPLSPHWGPKDPGGFHPSLYLSQSGHLRRFWAIICAARNCAQRMRPRATGKNPPSGSIIFPSVCPVTCGSFSIFLFILISSGGSSVAMHLLSTRKQLSAPNIPLCAWYSRVSESGDSMVIDSTFNIRQFILVRSIYTIPIFAY